jgi:hypothetical protein
MNVFVNEFVKDGWELTTRIDSVGLSFLRKKIFSGEINIGGCVVPATRYQKISVDEEEGEVRYLTDAWDDWQTDLIQRLSGKEVWDGIKWHYIGVGFTGFDLVHIFLGAKSLQEGELVHVIRRVFIDTLDTQDEFPNVDKKIAIASDGEFALDLADNQTVSTCPTIIVVKAKPYLRME